MVVHLLRNPLVHLERNPVVSLTRNQVVSLSEISNNIDFKLEQTEMDVLGDAYEFLIGQFASGAGKKAGEFYTPQEVSKVLAKIVTTGKDRKSVV